MHGLHLTADLRGCDAQQAPMHDADALRTLCLAQVAAAGLRAVDTLFHRFAPTEGQAGPAGASARPRLHARAMSPIPARLAAAAVCDANHDTRPTSGTRA